MIELQFPYAAYYLNILSSSKNRWPKLFHMDLFWKKNKEKGASKRKVRSRMGATLDVLDSIRG